MYSPSTIAALAEALHLDSYHVAAANAFAGLAASGEARATYALKAAVSFYAADDDVRGDQWFEQARTLKAPPDELEYLHCQRLWARGELAQAVSCFEEAMERHASSDLFGPALVMLLARADRREDARKLADHLLAHAPEDPYASINAVCLNLGAVDFAAAIELLRGAARKLPQRAETYVLYARLCRRHGLDADDALRKASLRMAYLGPGTYACAERRSLPTARAHVTGALSPEGFDLRIDFCFRNAGAELEYVLVNSGYVLSCSGREQSPVQRCDAPSVDAVLTPELSIYRLDPAMFQSGPDGMGLTLVLSGLPRPPAVRIAPQGIELGEASAWLPIFAPPVATRWTTELSTEPGFECFVSSRSAEDCGLAIITARVDECEDLRRNDADSIVVGSAPQAARQFAAFIFEKGQTLWRDRIGPCRAGRPPLVIADREDSTFCYAREGFVRAASGVLRDDRTASLLLHEAGHLWWGVDVRFEPESQWLAEALAEYTMHLAERSGFLPDYATSSLSVLERFGWEGGSHEGLRHLARRQDRLSAHLARVRGGFVISALREVLGDTAFWATLKAVHEEGRQGPINDYSFFALAARFHGRALTWFVNQWAHASNDLRLVVESPTVERFDDAYETRFTALALGSATPGANIRFAVRTSEGMQGIALNLDLGSCPASVRTRAEPLAIVPDPDVRWPASRVEMELTYAA